jgi:allantoinase
VADQLDLVIRARRAVVDGSEPPLSVGVRGGSVVTIEGYDADLSGPSVLLEDDEVLMPGLVDSHVHVNNPGRTDWEGFTTATKAAAAGE